METAPPDRMAPNCKALASPNCAANEPELVKETTPVKSFALFNKVNGPAPAFKVADPAPACWMIGPVCEIPTALMFKVPEPTLEDAIIIALASLMETLFAPVFLSATAPTKSLLADSSVMLVPALNEEVPFTLRDEPVCWEIAPVAMMLSIPDAAIDGRFKLPVCPMMMSPVVLETLARVVIRVLIEIPLEAARLRLFATASPLPLILSEELSVAVPVVSILAVLPR